MQDESLPSRREVAGAMALRAAAALGLQMTAAAAPRTGPLPTISLRRGMNLWPWFSLTREFPAPRTDFGWPPYQEGRAVPTRDDLKALRGSGIDFIRLPVDPGPHVAFTGAPRAELMDEVARAIELALAEDLSVILNLHPNGGTHHFTPNNLVGGLDAPMFGEYLDLVGRVADPLARFPPSRVAFEPLNEPPQTC